MHIKQGKGTHNNLVVFLETLVEGIFKGVDNHSHSLRSHCGQPVLGNPTYKSGETRIFSIDPEWFLTSAPV